MAGPRRARGSRPAARPPGPDRTSRRPRPRRTQRPAAGPWPPRATAAGPSGPGRTRHSPSGRVGAPRTDRAGADVSGHVRGRPRSSARAGGRPCPGTTRRFADPARWGWSCRALLPVVRAGVGFERGAEGLARIVEAGSGRPDRDAEDVRDLRRRQAGIVVEGQDRALLRLELAEATLDLVAIGDRAEVVGRPGRVGVGGKQPD